MEEQNFIMQTKIIQETFNDKRKIRCKLPIDKLQLEDNIHQEGNLFISENNEIIYLELQLTDFTEDELVKYVELAEALYEKKNCHVSIYIICPNTIDICVKE